MRIFEKFPCGYSIDISTSFFDINLAKVDNKHTECPLHGKDCCKLI